MHITPARSYRATLVPAGTASDEVDTLDALGQLPTIQLKSSSCEAAEQLAHHTSGLAVLCVERVEV
ncbi:hypothetical protein PMI14_05838 [Acidovorax sp. CF316]|uniref:hypothetical protein n=1 Tax=Acidovorax sp. CF316 TaxID=1144317 RepID=UPI00026BC7FE|nr:hypothetical protein [Acidovorax sp. CF316]EJE49595.1 hypothetical protein PMI14_05838 [Acidovorax sp. CF316]